MAAVELTDVESVRQFMQKSTRDKLQNDDIEALIPPASEAIQRHLVRELMPVSSAETRSFEFLPNGGLEVIDLKPYEYRVIHEVTLDPDLTPTVLEAGQYRPWPLPSRDGTYFGIRLTGLEEPTLPQSLAGLGALPFQTRRIDINADWGLGTVPAEVQHWCNVLVEAWARLRRAEESPTVEDLPEAVCWGLKRWERSTPSV
jgi:hypothetical protein